MNLAAQPVYEHGFDEDTLEELRGLRVIRLELAEQQLAKFEDTMKQLCERGLVSKEELQAESEQLRQELSDRVQVLTNRMQDSQAIYMDEIEFYLSFTRE